MCSARVLGEGQGCGHHVHSLVALFRVNVVLLRVNVALLRVSVAITIKAIDVDNMGRFGDGLGRGWG